MPPRVMLAVLLWRSPHTAVDAPASGEDSFLLSSPRHYLVAGTISPDLSCIFQWSMFKYRAESLR